MIYNDEMDMMDMDDMSEDMPAEDPKEQIRLKKILGFIRTQPIEKVFRMAQKISEEPKIKMCGQFKQWEE